MIVLVSIEETLKKVKVAYKSTVYEGDYLFILKNGKAHWADKHGSYTTEFSDSFAWKRINKKNLPDSTKEVIKWLCTL